MLPPSCTGIQKSVKTENLTSPEATLTAHTSFWSKLEQTEYEKWLRLWGCKHIQGFYSQDCWRYVDSTVCVCVCLCVCVCERERDCVVHMHVCEGRKSLGGRTKTRTETEHEVRERTQKVQNREGSRKKGNEMGAEMIWTRRHG